MKDVILWGALARDELASVVLGDAISCAQATEISDRSAAMTEGTVECLTPGDSATLGVTLALDQAQIDRLEFFLIASSGGAKWHNKGDALLLAGQRAPGSGGLETLVEAARETMRLMGKANPDSIHARFGMMLLRASTRLRAAREPAPQVIRQAPSVGGVQTHDARQPYANYFTVEEHDLQFPRFSGGVSRPITRAAFVGGDAVTILPYDPATDRVLVIEQFRFAPHVRGDPMPWVLEPPAGRIDPGETPQQAAAREMVEETGIAARKLLEIGSYYPSPGAWTEYLYSYVALCDLPEAGGRIAGLDSEEEDIYSHILGFEQALNLMQTGECDAGPLWLSLLWLAANRPGLRARA